MFIVPEWIFHPQIHFFYSFDVKLHFFCFVHQESYQDEETDGKTTQLQQD